MLGSRGETAANQNPTGNAARLTYRAKLETTSRLEEGPSSPRPASVGTIAFVRAVGPCATTPAETAATLKTARSLKEPWKKASSLPVWLTAKPTRLEGTTDDM